MKQFILIYIIFFTTTAMCMDQASGTLDLSTGWFKVKNTATHHPHYQVVQTELQRPQLAGSFDSWLSPRNDYVVYTTALTAEQGSEHLLSLGRATPFKSALMGLRARAAAVHKHAIAERPQIKIIGAHLDRTMVLILYAREDIFKKFQEEFPNFDSPIAR